MKPRLLDLFCGAGGAAMGYSRAGFEVVGVDIEPQPRYPFEFLQADALEVLGTLAEDGYIRVAGEFGAHAFDVIHASPPCQLWSEMYGSKGPDLITPLRPLLEETGLPYVIENVPQAPLKGPILCGSSFGLGVRRHRRFEASFPLMVPPCSHGQQVPSYLVYDHGKHYLSSVAPVYGTGGGKSVNSWGDAMGIDWMDREELAEAIPPAYTELIGHQLMAHIKVAA